MVNIQKIDNAKSNFTPLFFAKLLRLCQAAWGSGINSAFQVQPQILYWTVVWALTRPLQNIHLVIFNPFLCSFSYILRIIVLSLKNKSSLRW